MSLREFWRSTVGEILLVISADADRQRDDMAAQVIAITRALGAAFGDGDSDPLEGLMDRPERVPLSMDELRRVRFWRPPA